MPWSRSGTERIGLTRRLVGGMSVRLFEFCMEVGACCCGDVLAVPCCPSRSIAGGRQRLRVAFRLWACSDYSLFAWVLVHDLITLPSGQHNTPDITPLLVTSNSFFSSLVHQAYFRGRRVNDLVPTSINMAHRCHSSHSLFDVTICQSWPKSSAESQSSVNSRLSCRRAQIPSRQNDE